MSTVSPAFKPLHEQVVVILGASSGIGREAALQFGAAGARVVVAARNEAGLRSLVEEIERDGGQAAGMVADTSDFAQVKALADAAVARFGRIDTWVQNAAAALYARFTDLTPEEFKRVIDVNLTGSAYGAMAALPYLRANEDGGALIFVASVESEVPIPFQSVYGASKHGMKGFVDVLRMELQHDGIPVSVASIMPAGVNTPFYNNAKTKLGVQPQPPPPVYQPEHVAEAIVHAATHVVDEFHVGGAGKLFSLGQRFVPRATAWYLKKTAFTQQRTDKAKSADAPHNLFKPDTGDTRTHGDYDDQTKSVSTYVWLRCRPVLWNALKIALFLGVVGALAERQLSDD